ncbi:hypothetical protein F5Y13DRAFT_186099 [Hypoxylon sp. FL1857]|nr:hypothetical protein F5Y13DRAFT_186099 [Hypoxylon sp. FL1857]
MLAAGAVDARYYRTAIPEAIKPGDVFSASVEKPSENPIQTRGYEGTKRYNKGVTGFYKVGQLGACYVGQPHPLLIFGELAVSVAALPSPALASLWVVRWILLWSKQSFSISQVL